MKTQETPIPRKGPELVPCIPLVPEEVQEGDKTTYISYQLKVRPNGSNDQTYKKVVKRFSDGTPLTWIQTLEDLEEIWAQNKVNGGADQVATVKTILRADALTIFEAALEAQLEPIEGDDNSTRPTKEKVDKALQAVTLSVFPHRALETQKMWMRKYMKKPINMTYRIMQAKILKMNQSLPLFPNATEASKFSAAEILEILEFTLPAKWRAKFDLNSYVPTQHDRTRLLNECEALERNEKLEHRVATTKTPQKSGMGHKKNRQVQTNQRSKSPAVKAKMCSEHGLNSTHDSAGCWILHPNLKPAKFAKTKPGKSKEVNALLKNTSKAELYSMLMASKASHVEADNGKKRIGKSAEVLQKKKKRKVVLLDSSDESIQQMDQTPLPSEDEETPPPSEDEEQKPKAKKRRIKMLGLTEK